MNWIARLTLLAALTACGPASDSAVLDTGDTATLVEGDHTRRSSQLRPAVPAPIPSFPSVVRPLASLDTAPAVVPPAESAPTAPSPTVEAAAEMVAEVAPEARCAAYEAEGCYWMENTTGDYCWVPWSDTGLDQCKRLDSCDGGDGWSGGGCYKWSDGSSGARTPWPTAPSLERDIDERSSTEHAEPGAAPMDDDYGC